MFGAAKLIIGKRKVAKYAELAEARKAHLENVRSSRHIIELKGEDVPFGVKALESGIEIEGIVISRPATPATPNSNRSQQTLVGSDNDSLKVLGQPSQMAQRQSGRPLMYQPSPYIALPAPSYGISSMPSSSTSVASMPSGSNDDVRGVRAYSEPMLQHVTRSSRSESPASRLPASAVTARLEGLSSPSQNGHHRARSLAANSPSYPSSRTESRTPTPPDGHRDSDLPGDSDGPHVRPQFVSAYSTPNVPSAPMTTDYVPETARGDLSLLYTHRLSHAAEVGQLLPRNSRTSRLLLEGSFNHSPTNSISQSPTQQSPTNSFIISPAASDGVYALDVALPPTMPVSAALVHPALRGRFSAGSRSSSGERSRFSEDLPWVSDQLQQRTDYTVVPTPAAAPAAPTAPVEPEAAETKKKGPNRLFKKRGSGSARSSLDVDLEAQK